MVAEIKDGKMPLAMLAAIKDHRTRSKRLRLVVSYVGAHPPCVKTQDNLVQ